MARAPAPPVLSREYWTELTFFALGFGHCPIAKPTSACATTLRSAFRRHCAVCSFPVPDVIIASSPQLLVGLAGWWIAFSRQIPFVFEVRDLWPESLVAVGAGTEDSLLHATLGGDRALLVRAIQPDRGGDRSFQRSSGRTLARSSRKKLRSLKMESRPICSGPASVGYLPHDEAATRQPKSKFLLCYIGTHRHGARAGNACSTRLRRFRPRDPEAMFVLLIGEGAEKERIKSARAIARPAETSSSSINNRDEKIPAFISASDACLVLLKKTEIFKTVIPTKMLEFMSCARPVILGVDGQARQIIEDAGAGLVIEPENSEALVQSIERLMADRELGVALGRKGREYIREEFFARSNRREVHRRSAAAYGWTV